MRRLFGGIVMVMSIKPMSPFLGAEIEGVNLSGALSSDVYAAINNA